MSHGTGIPLVARSALLALAGLAAGLVGSAALADNRVWGPARVVDGDTLIIDRIRVELYGIDAPELEQTCESDSGPWDCGVDARAALAELIGGRNVQCSRDSLGPVFNGRCHAGGKDLNKHLVRQGWAAVNKQYSRRYVPHEHKARKRGEGIWASEFELPWEWRARTNGGEDPELELFGHCAGRLGAMAC